MNLKDLQLYLPDDQTIKDSLISTSRTKLRQELEGLPYGNMLHALDQVTQKLMLINKTEIPNKTRFEMLECFLPSFQLFFDHLNTTEKRSISSSDLQATDKLAQFVYELSIGYKLALVTFSESNLFKSNKLVERVYCAMSLVSLNLVLEFRQHKEHTGPHWRDLNQLFAFARSRRLLGQPIEFESPLPLADTIDGIYLQICIMAVSDPYQLLPEQILQTWYYLAENSTAAVITELEPHSAPDSGFVINLADDNKPQSFRWFDQASELSSINLDRLNGRVEQNLAQLKTDPTAFIPGLGNHPPEFKQELLNQLKRTWLQTSQRIEERVETQKTITMVYGIRDIHYLASHSSELLKDIHQHLGDQIIGNVMDESTSGACVLLENLPKHNLEPGQLVLLFETLNGRVQIPKLASVRWNTLDQSGKNIQLGVKYIPGQIYAFLIKSRDKVTVDTYPRKGLLLQTTPDDSSGWQVITAPGLYKKDRKLGLLFNGHPDDQPAVAHDILANSKHIQQFTIEILSVEQP